MYKNLDRFFFRFVTMHAFDRQTDRQTPFSRVATRPPCIQCSAVKTFAVRYCSITELAPLSRYIYGQMYTLPLLDEDEDLYFDEYYNSINSFCMRMNTVSWNWSNLRSVGFKADRWITNFCDRQGCKCFVDKIKQSWYPERRQMVINNVGRRRHI